ncbi:hypothetical protein [Marinigracilibium pacificum]|uniref:Uncharacterized protein n=1 Tax=Marinigracilibium pacificum TaxID=2729599 RepID=A0A848J8E6_9BACT|nr:hypothetical protein [Marinigracilibium pacificum]NMM50760.1 hypothetical protein [Marinigracilibium pacificum]
MIKRLFRLGMLCLLLTVILNSCHEEQVGPDLDNLEDTFGKKMKNPYSVQNMKQAWDNIKPELSKAGRYNVEAVTITTTHYYVRFLPKDSLEYEILLKDSLLELYSYPLDYEQIIEGEFNYHDPSIPADRPTYQYTVVLADYNFPNIEYKILEELFIPDDIGHTINGRVVYPIDECVQPFLINEAMRIAQHYSEIQDVEECGGGGYVAGSGVCSTCPRGQILVENPYSGKIYKDGKFYDGVPKVKARARKWFKIKTAYTDENGEFVIRYVFGGNREVNYGIKYSNIHAFIKPTGIGFGPAYLNGPKQSGRWEYRSHKGSRSYLWGAIMRGVYDYHYIWAPKFNIGRPPNDLKIRACANNDCGVMTMLHQISDVTTGPIGGWVFSDLRIGSKDDKYNIIYKIVIHELGHAAHWNFVGDWVVSSTYRMMFSKKMVREAWASGVADIVHQDKFKFLPDVYGVCWKGDDGNVGLQGMINMGYPLVLVRDLIDARNEYDSTRPECDVYDDVENFTMSEIFSSLRGVSSNKTNTAMREWRDNLIQKRPTQKDNLIKYFQQWEK